MCDEIDDTRPTSWLHVRDGPRGRVPCRGDPAGRGGRGAGQRGLVDRRAPRRDPPRVRLRARRWAGPSGGARHQGRPARRRGRLLDEGLPRHRGQATTGSTRATGRRAWTSRGAASWPRSTGGTRRAGTSRSTSRRSAATSGARPRWPRRSSPRRGRTTAGAGPRSPTPTGPRRGRRRRSSSCTCAGPRAARCAGAACR